MNTNAQKKLTSARTSLILDQPFFGALALSLTPKEDATCDTAWVDGRNLGYNPTFIESLDHATLVGLLAHEVMHCLAPETEVLTDKGLRPIADIHPGDKVWGKGNFAECLAIGSREYSGDIIRLRGAFGPSIRITPNHGVLCLRTEHGTLKSKHGIRKSLRLAGCNPESISFLPAGELDSSRDLLAFSVPPVSTGDGGNVVVGVSRKNYKQHTVHFDEDIAYLTGLFLADGNLSRPSKNVPDSWFGAEASKRTICITMHKDEDSNRIESIIVNKLRRTPKVYALKGKNAKRLYVSAKMFANFLQQNFYDGKSKSIPVWMLDQSTSIIRAFVEGLVEGDGTIKNVRTCVTTIFPQIAGMLPLLLMRIGIFASLSPWETNKTGFANAKPFRRISWEPKSSQVVRIGDYWLVRITENERENYSGIVHNFSTCQQRYSVPFFTVHNCAMGHPWRREGRDGKQFNIACDIAINGDLKDSGFTMGKDWLFPDASQKGKSAEWIYARLPQPEQGPSGKGKPQPGEVRDAPTGTDEDGNPAPTEGEWKQRTAEALQAAKMAGTLPSGLARMVETALDSRIDLKSLLLRFFTERTRADFNWNMPSRRYAHLGIYLPSLESTTMGEVAVLCDTSGSVSGPALQRARAILQECLDEVCPLAVTLYFVDTKIHGVHRMEPGDPLTWEPKGFGGTCFASFFEEIERSENPPVCIIGISDLAATFGTAPTAPVLWLTDTKGGTAPFGEVVYCDY